MTEALGPLPGRARRIKDRVTYLLHFCSPLAVPPSPDSRRVNADESHLRENGRDHGDLERRPGVGHGERCSRSDYDTRCGIFLCALVYVSVALTSIRLPETSCFDQSGLVGEDSVLSTLMLSIGSMGVVTVLWCEYYPGATRGLLAASTSS